MHHPDTPSPRTLTVTELNREARRLLESHFDYLWVEGEISNFAAPSSGHWYFTLKDGNAQVRCAMFRNRNLRIRPRPGNGDAVRIRCRVSLYEGRGEFQLIAEFMEPAGAGALQAAFEALKKQLQAEGLFDSSHKQALPERVSRLGVITSPTGAAIHDILTVLRRRWPGIEVFLFPVAVQGEAAAPAICRALAQANRWHADGRVPLDALIVGRGGGSLEDLWAFNEEAVARAIAASELPVVSAVGHEVDFSIADWVADVRAATPSAAAELLSPDREEWRQALGLLSARLYRDTRQMLARAARELHHLQSRLRHPGQQLREQAQRLDDLEQRLLLAHRGNRRRLQSDLELLTSRLRAQSPAARVTLLQSQLEQTRTRLANGVKRHLSDDSRRLQHLASLLDSVSPLRVLERGYAILQDSAGTVVREAAAQRPGDTLSARLAQGGLTLEVREILEDQGEGKSH